MSNEMLPTARDTIPPEPGEDFKHHSTLPPFASEADVQELKDKFDELTALLASVKSTLVTITNRVASFSDDIRRVSQRQTKLAARMAIIDGEEEGAINGHDTAG
jgi:hypothetical protein